MRALSAALPMIIDASRSFNCFAGFLTGSAELRVYDKAAAAFPAHVSVKTDLGGGGGDFELSGNAKLEKKVHGIAIVATITEWTRTGTELSFHLKVQGKKKIGLEIFKCTVFDQTLSGRRFDAADTKRRFETMLEELEKTVLAPA